MTEPRRRWPGFFISVEGVDGAGKSTQVSSLAVALRGDGYEVVTVREPGETGFGEMVRSLVLEQHFATPLAPWAEALLFVAARVQLLAEIVLPALYRGQVVIADRFVDSFLAYQGGGRGLDLEVLRRLHRDACGDVWPDLTVLLDLPGEVADRRRCLAQLPLDRIEEAVAPVLAAVAGCFRCLAAEEPGRIVTIDASRPAAEVAADVHRCVRDRLCSAVEASS